LLGAFAAALFGCPQLLDDHFAIGAAVPGTGLDSGDGQFRGASDAGAVSSASGAGGGASNAGGASGRGSAGSTETSEAGADGTAGSGANPDASGEAPFVPLTELGRLLVHRYRFEGTGNAVLDSVGTAHGTAVGAALGGSGRISLSGTSQEYVALPAGIVSSLTDATLEAWLNWQTASSSADADWQPIFDLGNSIDGSQTQSISHLNVFAQSGDTGHMSAAYTLHGFNGEVLLDTTKVLPASADPEQGTQVVLVASTTQGSLQLYLNGSPIGSTPAEQGINLSKITDPNNWLGHSQYGGDPGFHGEYLDFRIYASALTSDQVSQSFALGADAHL
jgi:hypothetical protein